MALKKNICVVTSTRADYGLLYWLIRKLESAKSFNLKLAVTGTHLSAAYGNTYTLIEQDQIRIDKKIPILNGSGTVGVGRTASRAIEKFTEYFYAEKPDAVILLGDRYEIMAIAQASVIAAIPVIHLHGGEISEGANDDLFRHAITKLSSFHFTSSKQHRNRVIQMGELPGRVKIAGALGIENIKKLRLLTRMELGKKYNILFRKRVFLITYHPATLEKESPEIQFKHLLKAIATFEDTTFVISKANADAGGDKINQLIDAFSRQNKNSLVSASFGQINYLSLMKLADVVIGNSSSGIIEAPSLFTPTLNIGTRQKGRLGADSIVHCGTGEKEILNGIKSALAIKDKKAFKNPYDHGSSSEKIVNALENLNFATLLPKKFYDL